jgi:hypothetical protein
MSIQKANPNLLIFKKHFKFCHMINQKPIMIITANIEVTHQKPVATNKIISMQRLIAVIEDIPKNNQTNNGKT